MELQSLMYQTESLLSYRGLKLEDGSGKRFVQLTWRLGGGGRMIYTVREASKGRPQSLPWKGLLSAQLRAMYGKLGQSQLLDYGAWNTFMEWRKNKVWKGFSHGTQNTNF